MGNTYSRLGQLTNADKYLNTASPLMDAYGDFNQVSKLYMSLGVNAYEMGDFDQALEYTQKSMELSITMENMELVVGLKTNLGAVYTQLHKYSEAETFLEESLLLKDDLKIEYKKPATLVEIARLNYYRDNLDYSLEYCEQTLTLLEKYPDPLKEGKTYHLIGLIKPANISQVFFKKSLKSKSGHDKISLL